VFEKCIGKGAYGEVWQGTWRSRPVAIKKIRPPEDPDGDNGDNGDNGVNNNSTGSVLSKRETLMRAFVSEVGVMTQIPPHPHIAQLYGYSVDPLFLVMEFAEKGGLRTLLNRQLVPRAVGYQHIRGIALGCQHLASLKIVHKDIAARNVIVSASDVAKLCDFGLSRLLWMGDGVRGGGVRGGVSGVGGTDAAPQPLVGDDSDVHQSVTKTGPLRWMAPESLRHRQFSEKSDVWAFAVTCVEILTARKPYEGQDALHVALAVMSGDLRPDLAKCDGMPERLRALLTRCTALHPEDRPRFDEIFDALDGIPETMDRS
jgi:serine/threonine protein kinase